MSFNLSCIFKSSCFQRRNESKKKKGKKSIDLLNMLIMLIFGASILPTKERLEVDHEVCNKFYDPKGS